MARSFARNDHEKPKGNFCDQCGETMPPEFYRGHDRVPSPVHCNGSAVSWSTGTKQEAHHGRVSYGRCWRCNRDLGCDQCAGPRHEVLCRICAVWAFPSGLAAHGPIINTDAMIHRRRGVRAPQVSDYPIKHQTAYNLANRNELNSGMRTDVSMRDVANEISRIAVPPQAWERPVEAWELAE